MEPSALTPYLAAGNFVLTWGIGFYVHMVNKNKVTNDRIKALEVQIAEDNRLHDERIARLESIAATAPSHEDLSKMYQSISQLGQTVHQLVGENRGQSDSLRLILSRLTEKNP